MSDRTLPEKLAIARAILAELTGIAERQKHLASLLDEFLCELRDAEQKEPK